MRTSLLALLLPLAFALSAPARAQDAGKTVYDATCVACHGTGAAGAPKLGDAAAWAARLKGGVPALVSAVKNGKGAMPPRGGNATLTDAQIDAAVRYMVAQAQPAAAAKPGAKPADAAAKAPEPAKTPAAAAKAPEPPKTAAAAAPAAGGGAAGKSVYDATCSACHNTGAAGAPKLGDAAAWGARLAGGLPALLNSARAGKGAMPPKGGNTALTDAQLESAVRYMVEQAGPAPAGGATARAPAAAPAATARPAEAKAPEAPRTAEAAKAAEGARPMPAPGASAPPPAAPNPANATSPATAATAANANQFNRLMRAQAQRNRPPAEDGIHDPANDGTLALQPPLAAFDALPRSNAGNRVDWVKSLSESKIAPRADKMDPKVAPMVMDLNVVREVKGSMPDVVYPHKQHTEWLDCSNCHPAIFKPQKGANQISMASILLGQACGTCHGKVAFPVSECRLCHSRPKSSATTAATAATPPAAPTK